MSGLKSRRTWPKRSRACGLAACSTRRMGLTVPKQRSSDTMGNGSGRAVLVNNRAS